MTEHPKLNFGLEAAIKAAGSVRELARLLGITHQAIAQWEQVPAARMLQIEQVTGVARERLRPDLYRIPQPDATDDTTTEYRCHCGGRAQIGIPSNESVQWLCIAHAPWVCAGCGPEDGDEDNYADAQEQQHD
jgi:hypothetical protein